MDRKRRNDSIREKVKVGVMIMMIIMLEKEEKKKKKMDELIIK